MQQIHDNDEKLFAHQTDLIVKRHIGALHGTGQWLFKSLSRAKIS